MTVHRLSFSSAGSGAARSHILNALIRRAGPSIVVSTEARRLADAWTASGAHSGPAIRLLVEGHGVADTFNPLDVLHPDIGGSLVTSGDVLSPILEGIDPSAVPGRKGLPHDYVWAALAKDLMHAAARTEFRGDRIPSFIRAFNVFFEDDVIYKLAVILDTRGRTLDPCVYASISSFLQLNEANRSSVLGVISTALYWANDPFVHQSTDQTSFDLSSIFSSPSTIFIEMPAFGSQSGSALVRLWLSALLQAARVRGGEMPVSVIVEGFNDPEIARVLSPVQRAGSGRVDVWSLWESVEQIRVSNPGDWSAFIGNSHQVEALGPINPVIAGELSDSFGAPRDALTGLGPNERFDLRSGLAAAPSAPVQFQAMGMPAPVGAGHRMTFAPSRADTWGRVAAAMSEHRDGTVIVLESAGECHRMIAGAREAIGPVVRLDPFNLLGQASDTFNPLDAYAADASDIRGIRHIAETIVPQDNPLAVDPYWRHITTSFIASILDVIPVAQRSVAEVRRILSDPDNTENELTKLLDADVGRAEFRIARSQLGYVLAKGAAEKQSIFAIAFQSLDFFSDPNLVEMCKSTSFGLSVFDTSQPSTVFIEFPDTEMIQSRVLIDLWSAAIIRLIGRSAHKQWLISDFELSKTLLPNLYPHRYDQSLSFWTLWNDTTLPPSMRQDQWVSFIDAMDRVEILDGLNPQQVKRIEDRLGATKA